MPKADAMFEIEPQNFEELAKQYGKSREFMLVVVNEFLRSVGRLLVPAVKAETPVGATSKLKRTTTAQVMGHGEDMYLEVRQSAFSAKGFPYGVAVRQGTKPHFPPYRALIPWVEKKLHVTGEQAPRVAFLVARRISQVGTKANPYHVRVLDENVSAIERLSLEAAERFGDKVNDIGPTE